MFFSDLKPSKKKEDSSTNEDILKEIPAIEIQAKKIVNTTFLGEYRSYFKKRGIDFSEVREYLYGDDLRDIDWKVTARVGTAHTKVYEEERELISIVVFDGSASNQFGTQRYFKSKIGARIAAILAFSAIKNNDKVGLVIFTETVEVFLPPKKGRKHVLRIIKEILSFKPKSKKTNFSVVVDFLKKVHKKKSLIFFISDFLVNPKKIENLSYLSRFQNLVAIRIYDQREFEMPSVGLLFLEDLETSKKILVDTSSFFFKKKMLKNKARLKKLKKDFIKMKIDFIDLVADDFFLKHLVQFFKK